MTEYFAMGSYGAYVWSCMGLTLIVMVICAVQSLRRQQSVLNDIHRKIVNTESVE
jgi:heme exporter protein CcmD